MTHQDIKTKFLIEYDKANVTSSYPLLTDYEIATILDKAYLALIAQKFTGNNFRRSGFETDIKSIEDLQPLITSIKVEYEDAKDVAPNVIKCDLPIRREIIEGYGPYYSRGEEKFWSDENHTNEIPGEAGKYYKDIMSDRYYIYSPDSSRPSQPYVQVGADTIQNFNFLYYVLSLLDYNTTEKYISAQFDYLGAGLFYIYGLDSIKLIPDVNKVYYCVSVQDGAPAEKNKLYRPTELLPDGRAALTEVNEQHTSRYDGVKLNITDVKLVTHDIATKFFTTANNMPWIKNPVCYIEDGKLYVVYDLINDSEMEGLQKTGTIVCIKEPEKFVNNPDSTEFELNDSMAEELITLAIVFALENIESTRLNSKLNLKSLEA